MQANFQDPSIPPSGSRWAHGLGLAIGVAGILYEITYDQLRHPIIIPYLIPLFGIARASESIARALLRNRTTVQFGWLKMETIPTPPPPTVTTLAVPEKLAQTVVDEFISPSGTPPSSSSKSDTSP